MISLTFAVLLKIREFPSKFRKEEVYNPPREKRNEAYALHGRVKIIMSQNISSRFPKPLMKSRKIIL